MASVLLSEVDDYISPSQACINPLFTATSDSQTQNKSNVTQENHNGNKNKTSIDTTETTTRTIRKRKIIKRRNRVPLNQNKNITHPQLNLEYDDDHLSTLQIQDTNISNTETNPSLSVPTISSSTPKKKSASVSVADCLACSGCVTSAEAVLVTRHTTATLISNCTGLLGTYDINTKRTIAFTISPACIADLMRFLYSDNTILRETPTALDFFLKLCTFLHQQLGADIVLDAVLANEISLIESSYEFIHRYKHNQLQINNDRRNDIATPTPSIAISATETKYIIPHTEKNHNTFSTNDSTETSGYVIKHPPGRNQEEHIREKSIVTPLHMSIPVLSSSCPGFVCYVEKTTPKSIPYLSSVKSSMAIAGTLLKHGVLDIDKVANRSFDTDKGKKIPTYEKPMTHRNDDIYHVAIMPCHDKKLEASRKDLAWEQQTIQTYPNMIDTNNDELKQLNPDIDHVITTNELFSLLKDVSCSSLLNRHEKLGDNACIDHANAPDGVDRNRIDEGEPIYKVKDCICQYLNNLPVTQISDENLDTKPTVLHKMLAFDSYRNRSHPTSNNTSPTSKMESSNSQRLQKASPLETIEVANSIFNKVNTSPSPIPPPIGSGSYADFIFRYAAKYLFQFEIPSHSHLPWKSVTSTSHNAKTKMHGKSHIVRRRKTPKNTDLFEVTLYKDELSQSFSLHIDDYESNTKVPVLKFGIAYGFKNVQIVLQQIAKDSEQQTQNSRTSMGTKQFDYIEIMACPKGCVNGGGHITNEWESKMIKTRIENGIFTYTDVVDEKSSTKQNVINPAQTRERVKKSLHYMGDIMQLNSSEEIREKTSYFPFLSNSFMKILYSDVAIDGFRGFESQDTKSAPSLESAEINHRLIISQNKSPTDTCFGPFGKRARAMLHTRFYHIPKLELTIGATAGVAVDAIKW